MRKCPQCGRMYSDMVSVCPACKVSIDGNAQTQSAPVYNPPAPSGQQPVYTPPVPAQPVPAPAPAPAKVEGNCFGWSVLSFFIPLVGLILYFCWKKEKPKAAKASLNGMITRLVIYAVTFLIGFLGALASSV